MRANRVFAFLYGWSASVIAIYFTHWLVVGWGVGVFGFRSQPLAGALIGIVVAIVATALLSRFADRPRDAALAGAPAARPRASRRGRAYGAACARSRLADWDRLPYSRPPSPGALDRCRSSPSRPLHRCSPRIAVAPVHRRRPTSAPGGTDAGRNPPPAATQRRPGDDRPVLAGEPCSYLTAEEVGAIVGTVPVEVEERAGPRRLRLLAGRRQDAKVNIGVVDWADGGESTFESTKGFGESRRRSTSVTRRTCASTTRASERWSWSRPATPDRRPGASTRGDSAAQLRAGPRSSREAVYNKI